MKPVLGKWKSRRDAGTQQSERGAAIPIVALMMFVLLGLSAFAVDLGWFYLHANRIQRAADAAALAGVIHMPQDFAQAESDALGLAAANGYVDDTDTSIAVAEVPDQPSQLQVTVRDTVNTFFLRVFGKNFQEIERSARAEFLPPLPLGSPDHQFGNICDPGVAGCSNQPNFWANIHGKYTRRGMGDAYSPICSVGNGTGCVATNPLFRERGYLYGIEAPPGSSFTVQFVDIIHHNISEAAGGCSNTSAPQPVGCTSDWIRTGDRGCEDWGTGSLDCGQTVVTTLYGPDADPLDVSNNPLLCEQTWQPQPQVAHSDPYGLDPAASCFTVTNASGGIYVLQVRVQEPTQVQWSGLNRYGVGLSNSSARIYALGDMSIYNNFTGTISEFHLAEVDSIYRGKTYVVELFDPGEGNGFVQLMSPSGAGWSIHGSCRMLTRPTGVMTGSWTDQGVQSPCQFQADNSTSQFHYDDRWVRLEVTLPDDYECGANCWWKINYNYSGGVNDTTTWRAFIVGNPIHLVPSD